MQYLRYDMKHIREKLDIKIGNKYRFFKRSVTVIALYDYWILCVDMCGVKTTYTYADIWCCYIEKGTNNNG